jgi:iron complex outermembrane receptor protein
VEGRIDESLRKENCNVGDADIRYEDKRLRGRVHWRLSPQLTLSDEIYYLQADRHWKDVEQYEIDPTTSLAPGHGLRARLASHAGAIGLAATPPDLGRVEPGHCG